VLEASQHDVRLVDAPAWNWSKDDVIADVKRFNPRLLVIDTSFTSLRNDLSVAEAIKNNLEGAEVVLVGPPASQFAEKMLANEGVDIVARFEYDFTLRDIVQAMEDGKDFDSIKGISYKKGDVIVHNPNRGFISSVELDKIPFVSRVYRRHLRLKDYFLSSSLYPEVQIFTGRGCPYRCTFCSWPETFTGREYRTRSVENIVDELDFIRDELPEVKEVFLEDDTFTIDGKRVHMFCQEIKRRRLKVVWSCNARANLDFETMRSMKQAGCRLLIVGYESGSDDILKNVRKGISTERMRQFTQDAKKAGLMIHGDFIIGLPGETVETAKKTLQFIQELKPNILQVAVATPIPGTEFYQWAEENGSLLVKELEEALDGGGFQQSIVSYSDFTKKDIDDYVDKALKRYYLSPSYVPMALKNILRRNGLQELRMMTIAAKGFFRYLGRRK
jgi:radical SAM superfamily enzyme YgiQ (UPF0313 family)